MPAGMTWRHAGVAPRSHRSPHTHNKLKPKHTDMHVPVLISEAHQDLQQPQGLVAHSWSPGSFRWSFRDCPLLQARIYTSPPAAIQSRSPHAQTPLCCNPAHRCVPSIRPQPAPPCRPAVRQAVSSPHRPFALISPQPYACRPSAGSCHFTLFKPFTSFASCDPQSGGLTLISAPETPNSQTDCRSYRCCVAKCSPTQSAFSYDCGTTEGSYGMQPAQSPHHASS